MKIDCLIFSNNDTYTRGGVQEFTRLLPVVLKISGIKKIRTINYITLRQKNFLRRSANKIHNFFRFFMFVKYLKPSVIISTEWDPCGYLTEMCKIFLNYKSAFIVHGQEIYRCGDGVKGYFKKKIRNWTFKKADKVIAVSSYTALRIRQEKILRLIDIAPNSFDRLKFSRIKRARKFFQSNEVRLVTLSRIVERKGHIYAIKALERLIQKGLNVAYKIIGDGKYFSFLQEYVSSHDLDKQVKCYRNIPDADIVKIIADSDIFIHPNFAACQGRDFEGFGIVLLEAMSAGLPVIAGIEGGCTDIITNGYNGFLVKGQDINELVEIILKLKDSPQLAQSIAARAKEDLSRFFPETVAIKYQEIFKGYFSQYRIINALDDSRL
jgi:glycosyltransferase involved in cell wall biosynthesis